MNVLCERSPTKGVANKTGIDLYSEAIYHNVVNEYIEKNDGLLPRIPKIYLIISDKWKILSAKERQKWDLKAFNKEVRWNLIENTNTTYNRNKNTNRQKFDNIPIIIRDNTNTFKHGLSMTI